MLHGFLDKLISVGLFQIISSVIVKRKTLTLSLDIIFDEGENSSGYSLFCSFVKKLKLTLP